MSKTDRTILRQVRALEMCDAWLNSAGPHGHSLARSWTGAILKKAGLSDLAKKATDKNYPWDSFCRFIYGEKRHFLKIAEDRFLSGYYDDGDDHTPSSWGRGDREDFHADG